MSFSKEVKDELIEVRLRRESDGALLVCGATLAVATLKYSRSLRRWGLRYVSESEEVIRFIAKLACRAYELESEISLNVHERLKARNTELFLCGKGVDKLMEDAGLVTILPNGEKSYELRIPEGLSSEHALRAFIRGMFLICGSVSDPEKGCHAEIVLKNEAIARGVCSLLKEKGIPPKVTRRRNLFVVYIKSGDVVEDLVTFMGAGESTIRIAEQRVLRQVKNNSNREVNCFNANMDKAAKASAHQVEDITLILTELGSDALSEELYEVAMARMEEPELTLSELSAKIGIGRSAVNYRLKKIAAIAEDIRAKRS